MRTNEPATARPCPGGHAPLWAGEGLRRAAGDTLRPGGLKLTEHALALAGVEPGSRVLDAGCGLGATVRRLRELGYRAVGLDASPAQLARGDGRGLPLAAADAEALPIKAGRLDAVLCECVLSLLKRPGKALSGLSRILVPGGKLIVSDLCRRAPGDAQGPDKNCAQGAFDLDAFPAMVEAAGFEAPAMENHDKLLKELAARLILADVWHPGADAASCAAPRLGYFLLIARRIGGTP